jgi:hypothetical protein
MISISNRELATPDNHGKPCSHVPVGRAHGAQRRVYISSAAHERRSMLAIDNSSRYSREFFGEVAEWLKAALC